MIEVATGSELSDVASVPIEEYWAGSNPLAADVACLMKPFVVVEEDPTPRFCNCGLVKDDWSVFRSSPVLSM